MIRRLRQPGVMVVAWFGGFILAGAGLLSLPISQTGQVSVSVGDAAFTAASAVTVTGLIVVDTGSAWSGFGEVVLMALIQFGGLGIMTVAGFFGIALNRKLGLRSGLLAGTELGLTDLGVLRHLIRDLVAFVFGSELLVALLLSGRFMLQEENGFLRSIHLGAFHAISAFNNAGFSIFGNGLEGYVGDWFVNLVIAGAFIIGGLGFPVVFEVRRRWRRPHSWSLHTKVTLAVSGGLLAIGTLLIGLLEWGNEATYGSLAADEKLLASFFQSATARTAGFNTVSIQAMRPGSWLVLVLFMVIGASSASTGGGIKTSTFAVVVRTMLAELRSDASTTLFNRRVPPAMQRQALALVVAALGTVGTGAFVLSALQPELPMAQLLFEASSAFGTVGISAGATPELNTINRFVIVVLMFVGRVGPITFGTAVLARSEARKYGFAEEPLIVG